MRWLDAAHAPSMVIGGVAASVLGRPRLTQDVDALAILPEKDWQGAVELGTHYGISPRIENAVEFAKRSRVLLLRHLPSGINIDVTLGGLPFEHDAVARCEHRDVGGVHLRLPRVEDLLVMKAIAHRPKDIEDLRGLLAAHPEADIEAVRKLVGDFASATGMPDMLRDFDALVAKRRQT
jgi:hypothetical protein